MSWLFKGSKSAAEASEPENDFAMRPIFAADYNLSNLDLLETVGTGTFGRVRLVKDIKSKSFYALKIMKKARIVRLKQIEHVLSEVMIISHFQCNFTPQLFAVFQDDNNLYMMTEFLPGGELFSHIRRNEKLPADVAKFYILEVAAALKCLHKLDIVYRDVKPENILINKDGHIKLVDFGFAKKLSKEQPLTYTLCGTPEYLAPETIQGLGHEKAVDWWAVGVLLYEMLVGYPPFFADNPFSLYQKILKGSVKFPLNSVSSVAQAAIKGFLNTNKGYRLGYTTKNGFSSVEKCLYFKGVDWESVLNRLVVPPILPSIHSDGDTSNFDYYPEEAMEEVSNLTSAQRELFYEFDRILERPVQM